MVPKRIRRAAEIMLGELESQQLTVHKVPSRRREGMVRVVEQSNPAWYQEFCAAYPSARKDADRWREAKTAIKRKMTLKALRHLAAGNMESKIQPYGIYGGEPYTVRLLPVIEKWIESDKKRRAFEKASAAADKVPF